MSRSSHDPLDAPKVTLKLYVARSTPNSVRAEQNLLAALAAGGHAEAAISLEVIDVFSHGKRATIDGVIVTPTLICTYGDKRQTIVGDLSNSAQLHSLLETLRLRSEPDRP